MHDLTPTPESQQAALSDEGHDEWLAAKDYNNWTMPDFPRWQTLPIIRFWVALGYAIRLEWWNMVWAKIGRPSSGYDEWVVFGLKKGWR